MLINKIVNKVNGMLAGETLSYTRMITYLDEVGDEINARLCSTFPTVSEAFDLAQDEAGEPVSLAVIDYSYFPDEYIRGVLCKGAAYKFYIQDEEGIVTADKYGYEYKDALFTMERDFLALVPEEFQKDTTASVVKDEYYRSGNMPFSFNQFGE